MTSSPLWSPSKDRQQASNLIRFMEFAGDAHDRSFADFAELHAWSIERSPEFWDVLWDFAGVKAQTRGDRLVSDQHKMPGARFFPDARLNFAENLLANPHPDQPAMIFRGEDKVRREVSWETLEGEVSRINQALLSKGLASGDRVCAIMPNMPETMMAFLAAAAAGGTWSSCSPDFGAQGILDRFSQIEPKFLIACDGYYYNGKTHLIGDKLAEVIAALPSLKQVIIIDYVGQAEAVAAQIDIAVTLGAALEGFTPQPIKYEQLAFDHPIYILFSSGTTGAPKCIVHRAGGALLKHISEHRLHCNLNADDRVFYFTTCGWMMWNWLVSGLSTGSTLLLYDGSPFYPSERVLFDFADEEGMTFFGTSAKFIDAVKKTGWSPKDSHDLSRVHTISSTGSTLVAESFDFVYEHIKQDVHLASMSGGTDLCGCFVAANPLGPVYRGEIQAKGLGLDVQVFDENARPIESGKGELVCVNAFPSMPIGFWNDISGKKYHNAYFAKYPNIWCHGDFAEWTENGGMIIHGRSDATLNPGGVRIGTAEIYAQVELIDEVIEALAIGQLWQADTRVVLFVRLRDGVSLSDELQERIRKQIRSGASPRHIPARIVHVADIPRTKSGKITELAVRDIVHGRDIKNKEALANPEALELFRDIPELQV